jgi:uncharacterized protein YdhG (YjbR/CyaY superfamily)
MANAMKGDKPADIDQYIEGFPPAIRKHLQAIRKTISEAAPAAQEAIKYAIPTFVYNGNLVHFAAYTNHIGFYPAPPGIKAFEKELSIYKQGKGSLQFPLDQPMPLELIARIVKFRVKQNQDKSTAKTLSGKKTT